MKVAIPCDGQQITGHFGHAPQFAFIEVDAAGGAITGEQWLEAPPHQPGLLPRWLAEQGANVVLAQGMGGRAVDLLNQAGVTAVVGITMTDPREAALAYVRGQLTSGDNTCGHDSEHGCGH